MSSQTDSRALRTMTFVPGYITKFLEKARELDSDAVILDLEDSVPVNNKQEARKNVKAYLDADAYRQLIFVRVNAIESGLLMSDLEVALHDNTDGIMFTKVVDEHDIVYFDKLLSQLEVDRGFDSGKFLICPLIESASAVIRAYEIAKASPRVIALVFGAEDYLRDLSGLHKEHGTSILVPRSLIVMAARAAGIEAIDTPFLDIRDSEGFAREVRLARELGFSGTLIIHPSQLPIANEAFSPSPQEIAEAREIIKAIESSERHGLGVALLGGKLIGPPMEKRARSVLAKIENDIGKPPS